MLRAADRGHAPPVPEDRGQTPPPPTDREPVETGCSGVADGDGDGVARSVSPPPPSGSDGAPMLGLRRHARDCDLHGRQ